MKKLLILLFIITTTALLLCTLLLRYISTTAEKDTKVKSDVIIVLGGHVISGTDCFGPICQQKGFVMKPHNNPCVVARVDHAVDLYKNGYAPKILMTGGTDKETNANEAETMKKWAMEAGVPEKNILIENKSTSTYENFDLSHKILSEFGLHSVIIVTEPYHIPRAQLVAAKQNYTYSVSPAVNSTCWEKNDFFANWNFVKKELVALIGYKLLNKI